MQITGCSILCLSIDDIYKLNWWSYIRTYFGTTWFLFIVQFVSFPLFIFNLSSNSMVTLTTFIELQELIGSSLFCLAPNGLLNLLTIFRFCFHFNRWSFSFALYWYLHFKLYVYTVINEMIGVLSHDSAFVRP